MTTWCRNAYATTDIVYFWYKCRCRANFFSRLPAFIYDFQQHLTTITSAAAVYGRPVFIPFHHHQCGREGSWVYRVSLSITTSRIYVGECIPFHQRQCGRWGYYTHVWTCRVYPCVDVQGVSIFTTSTVDKWTMDMRGASFFTACSVDIQGVFLSIKSAMFSCRMYSSPPSTVWTCRVYSSTKQIGWTWGYPPYHQQCRLAGCILLTVSSVDVQGVSSLPSAV
jgi:hypothetical protein